MAKLNTRATSHEIETDNEMLVATFREHGKHGVPILIFPKTLNKFTIFFGTLSETTISKSPVILG